MTVAELITLLQTFPQDAPVLIPSYEGGYEPPHEIILGITTLSAYTNEYMGPFNGPYCHGTDAIPAIFFERAT